MIPWILISIAIGIVLLGVVAFMAIKMKKEKKEPDYRTWFIIGCSWIPLGIATENPAFWIMGIVFMILGLANKNKWKEKKKWSELNPKERKTRIVIMSVLGILVLSGVVLFFLVKKGII